jgi:hypothetical protein
MFILFTKPNGKIDYVEREEGDDSDRFIRTGETVVGSDVTLEEFLEANEERRDPDTLRGQDHIDYNNNIASYFVVSFPYATEENRTPSFNISYKVESVKVGKPLEIEEGRCVSFMEKSSSNECIVLTKPSASAANVDLNVVKVEVGDEFQVPEGATLIDVIQSSKDKIIIAYSTPIVDV